MKPVLLAGETFMVTSTVAKGYDVGSSHQYLNGATQFIAALATRHIEVRQIGGVGANAKPVTGLEIRNEVYQALASGCTAIGYFSAVFQPAFSPFAVSSENQDALKKINAEVTALTPQLLTPEAKQQPDFAIDGGLKSLIHATSNGTRMTVIALNMDGKYRSGSGTIKLPGLKKDTGITVYCENRVIKAEDGQWKDNFGPLAVHIYVLNEDSASRNMPSVPE